MLTPTAPDRRLIRRCCVALALLVAFASRAAPLNPGPGRFTNLGPQLSARTFQAAAFTRDARGSDLLCAVVRSQPAAKLLVIDAATGALRQSFPLAGANGAWAAVTASDGSVYVGTEAHGKLFRYVPGETAVRDLGAALRGETYVWSLACGADGEVFGATYPGCRVFRYSPIRGFEEPQPGAIVPGEKYARAIACDPAAQTLFVGVGVTKPHLIELDLRAGSRRELLPAGCEAEQSVYALSLCGDYLLAKLNPSQRTLVFDRRTRDVVGEIEVSGLYQPIGSMPSPPDGKIYYVRSGELFAFDPKAPRDRPRPLAAVSSSLAMTWLSEPVATAGASAPAAHLTIFTQAGEIVRFDPVTAERRSIRVISPEEPTMIQSIAAGPDGRIWMGGYLSGGAAAFDPAVGRTQRFTGISQPEQIVAFGDKLYFGLYPRGRVFELDPAKPWNPSADNPRRIALLPDQSRPVALLAWPAGQRLVIGTIPEYGRLGGMLALWHVARQELETFPAPVARQAIASLAATGDLILAGTTVEGGLGIEPTEKEAVLFAWDPEARRKRFELVPVAGRRIVSGLTPMRDGTVWGFAEGALFVFDVSTRQVTRVRDLFGRHPGGAALWQDAGLLAHPNGFVYAITRGQFLRLDPRTLDATELRDVSDAKHTRPIALDTQGRIYFSQGVELWRYEP